VALLAVGTIAGYAVGRSVSNAQADGHGTVEPTATAEVPATVPPAASGSDTPVQPVDIAPTAPVPAGSAIATITTPPESTLAMIDPSKLDAGARYTVTFSPYGFGPPQSGSATLVVNIAEAVLETENVTSLDFTGRNVLALVDPAEAPVTEGGTYTATMTFREDGGLLLPVLGGITAAE
jgi:hypothetical protein